MIEQESKVELRDMGNLTVEEWINAHLETCIKEAEACVDDAIDEVAIANKQQREEIRNIQHARSVKSRSTKEILWDIAITIIGVGDDAAEHLEKQFVLRPYPRPDGMVRIGRSTSAEFEVPHGISLFFDPSVSVWHGKFTNVKNSIYYSDLHTRNGSIINGKTIPVDTPIQIKDGDELTIGDVCLLINLIPVEE